MEETIKQNSSTVELTGVLKGSWLIISKAI